MKEEQKSTYSEKLEKEEIFYAAVQLKSGLTICS
jgi:hypothetical protein